MPSRSLRAALLAGLAAPLALAAAACSTSGPTPRVEKLLGGPQAAAVLADLSPSVTRQAWRIDGMGRRTGAGNDAATAIHGYPRLSGPVPVDAASAALLRDVLLSDGTYLWNLAKGCEFLPGVVVRHTGGATTVDVLLCFSCDELETYVDGRKAGHEDFDPRRADLVRVAKSLFPDDEAIQGLE